jgi:hypothetical protein
MELTQRVLLRAARGLDRLPENSSLSAWIFLSLMKDLAQESDCHDPWRILTAVEGEAPLTADSSSASVSAPTHGETEERHLAAHPHCGALLEKYRRYLRLSEDVDLTARAGWAQAAGDLDLFLTAQFGDEHPEALRGRVPWRHWLPSFPWGRSRATAAIVIVAAAILAVLLWKAWHVSQEPAATTGRSSVSGGPGGSSRRQAPPQPPIQAPLQITGAGTSNDGSELRFHWDQFSGVTEYRLRILTAKLDTLYASAALKEPALRISVSEVPALRGGGSFLFVVDGMKERRRVCSSGFTPFDLPQ